MVTGCGEGDPSKPWSRRQREWFVLNHPQILPKNLLLLKFAKTLGKDKVRRRVFFRQEINIPSRLAAKSRTY
jgi:hypothetical protein